jgi:hypothetical protein
MRTLKLFRFHLHGQKIQAKQIPRCTVGEYGGIGFFRNVFVFLQGYMIITSQKLVSFLVATVAFTKIVIRSAGKCNIHRNIWTRTVYAEAKWRWAEVEHIISL